MKKIMLIVDDDTTSILMHQIILKKTIGEAIIKEFLSATTALKFLKEIQNPGIFHFTIFLDLYLPEMSGWEFLSELEKNSKLNYSTHIVTISDNPEDKLKSKSSPSVLSYTQKPLTLKKFSDLNLSQLIT